MIHMALFEIFAVLLFNGPYAIGQIYSISTANLAKDAYRQAQEQLVNTFFCYLWLWSICGKRSFPLLTKITFIFSLF